MWPELAKLGNACLAAVQAYDAATESVEKLQAAELKFQDIINSPSLDAACRKIDNLAEKKELDSTLVLMITKAWSASKESNMMKDEVNWWRPHQYPFCMLFYFSISWTEDNKFSMIMQLQNSFFRLQCTSAHAQLGRKPSG